MKKVNISSHPPKEETPTLNTTNQEIREKLNTINKFMKNRKKWEKGLFSSETIIG